MLKSKLAAPKLPITQARPQPLLGIRRRLPKRGSIPTNLSLYRRHDGESIIIDDMRKPPPLPLFAGEGRVRVFFFFSSDAE
jgi:hypothetical protein